MRKSSRHPLKGKKVLLSRKPHPKLASGGFTLIEIIITLALLALLTGAVYSISSAALEATRATLNEQVAVRRLEAFLRVTRDAFANLPQQGRAYLRFTRAPSGAPVPEVVFEDTVGVFGVPSLGGGSLVLAARPRADGSRTFAMLRIPRDLQGRELERFMAEGAWIPLLPRVERVKWLFFANGQWREDWPPENGRPQAVRLQFDDLEMPGSSVDTQFWIPPLDTNNPAPPISTP